MYLLERRNICFIVPEAHFTVKLNYYIVKNTNLETFMFSTHFLDEDISCSSAFCFDLNVFVKFSNINCSGRFISEFP